ncbi:hypothetical protein TSUD_220250 [Trifolium subterraneum]|uniref:Uncharacterized protein n=1 Tax=Trifolium subterraneum TaxID=3900 RepID=A0A2Z6N7X1_TRISU|nr:hypothetical protein TSUD_220250 [Trifolium subterraneum]
MVVESPIWDNDMIQNFATLSLGMEPWDPMPKKSRRYVVETVMEMIRVKSRFRGGGKDVAGIGVAWCVVSRQQWRRT